LKLRLSEIDCKDTILITMDVPKNLPLNDKVIEINYLDLNPFPEGNYFALKINDRLLIWFSNEKNKFIPNCIDYILPILKKKKTGIFFIDQGDNVLVFPVKEGKLLGQYIVSKEQASSLMENLKLKYKIDNVEELTKPSTLLRLINKVYLLAQQLQFKLTANYRESFKTIATYTTVLGIIVTTVILSINIAQAIALKLQLNKLASEIERLSITAKQTKEKFFFMERISDVWSKVNINFQTLTKVIANILKVLDRVQIRNIEVHYDKNQNLYRINLDIVSYESPTFLDKISRIEGVKDVKVIGSFPLGSSGRVYKVSIVWEPKKNEFHKDNSEK